MARFLIEVSQRSRTVARKWIRDSVREMGSHFATHADWKRKDDACIGTMIVEIDDRRSALGIVPPNMRLNAHVVRVDAANAA